MIPRFYLIELLLKLSNKKNRTEQDKASKSESSWCSDDRTLSGGGGKS